MHFPNPRRQKFRITIIEFQLFLNKNDLNSGLYEGEVKGRRRFGETQVPHGLGSIYYFSNDKFNRYGPFSRKLFRINLFPE